MEKKPTSDNLAGGQLAPQHMISVATIVAPHGINGWVKLHAEFGPPDLLLDMSSWWLARPNQHSWREVQPQQCRRTHTSLLAKLPNIDDRNVAAVLAGTIIGVKRVQMPILPKEEYYWCDLIDLRVVGEDGLEMGEVNKVLTTQANDILEITGEGNTLLVPFVDRYIVNIDLSANLLITSWRPEYLDVR